MRIAICDDEKIHREKIELHLERFHDLINHESGSYENGEALLTAYNNGKRFDVIFLDVKMKTIDGIETAREIRKLDQAVIIIFVSSILEYATRGYEVNAYRYMLKPVTEEAFDKAFLKVIQELESKQNENYVIKNRDGVIALRHTEIEYLESLGRKVIAHTKGEVFEFYARFSDEEIKLSNKNFVRIHKSILVNMEHIKLINKTNIELKNGAILPVSEKRRKDVFDKFTEFLVRRTQ